MKFELYPSKDGFRWRLVAKNGKIVADSDEAYVSMGNARRAAKAVRKDMGSADIVEVKGERHE